MNGWQVTYWTTSGKPAPAPRPGTRITVYLCQKCALRFDTPIRFKCEFEWCPCCKSPDIKLLGKFPISGTNVAINVQDPIEPIIFLDLLDGEIL